MKVQGVDPSNDEEVLFQILVAHRKENQCFEYLYVIYRLLIDSLNSF